MRMLRPMVTPVKEAATLAAPEALAVVVDVDVDLAGPVEAAAEVIFGVVAPVAVVPAAVVNAAGVVAAPGAATDEEPAISAETDALNDPVMPARVNMAENASKGYCGVVGFM